MRSHHHGHPELVMANAAASSTPPVLYDTTTVPDWPVAVTLTPAGMPPAESVVNVGEPVGQVVAELVETLDS